MPSRTTAAAWSTEDTRYDHLAVRYDRLAELLDAPLRAWLRVQLPGPGRPGLVHGGRALDLGCGTGLHAQLLADHYGEVLAVDRSAAMLRHARRRRHRPSVTYRHGDLREVSAAEDGRFDLILASRVLHEIPAADPAAGTAGTAGTDGVLRSIRGLVRPGGRVLLVDLLDPTDPVLPVDTRPAHAVDPRRLLDRGQARSAARRGWWADLRHRGRPMGEGLELLRLLRDPDWLQLVAATAVWPAPQWHRRCAALFPGARVTALPSPLPFSPSSTDPPCATHALAWTAPEHP